MEALTTKILECSNDRGLAVGLYIRVRFLQILYVASFLPSTLLLTCNGLQDGNYHNLD